MEPKKSKIRSKLNSMSNDALESCYDALMNTVPRGWLEFWDAEHTITMTDWAENVNSEMEARKLK